MEANKDTSEARSTPELSENVPSAANVAEGAGGGLGLQAPNSKKRAYPGTTTAPATDASDDRPLRDLSRINYPKKRVSVACELCRSRKTRCDAKKPSCSFCLQTGVPCIYRTTVISTNQAPKTSNGEDHQLEDEQVNYSHWQNVIARLDRIETLLEKPGSRWFGSLEPESPANPSIRSLEAATSLSASRAPVGRRRHGHQQNESSLVGLTLSGLSRLVGQQCPLPLYPLADDDDDEAFLERQAKQGEALFQNSHLTVADLSITTRSLWRLQNSFAHNVLPWCPLFDQKDCVNMTTRTYDAQFPDQSLETCLTLFVLALGALTRSEHHVEDSHAGDFPGLDYFQVASKILGCDRSSRLYCLYCLRPLQAFDAIHEASLGVVALVQCKKRLETDTDLQRMTYRAYWACYLLEHELQAYISYSACLLQSHHDFVPLPLSDHDEPGMYWFLAEVAFRRILSNPHAGIGWNANTLHAPVVVDEIISQIDLWYAHLPNQLKFPLGLSPVLDLHKGFLRGQYYSINSVLSWSHVVRLLTNQAHDEQEMSRDLQAAARSLEFSVLAIFSVESLVHERHLLLLANLFGIYTQVMLLLCTYRVPELAAIQQPSQLEAIRKGRSLLAIWMTSAEIASYVDKIDHTMMAKGIAVYEHTTGTNISPNQAHPPLVRTNSIPHGHGPSLISGGRTDADLSYLSRYSGS
ncbi:Fungal Zn2-Cys6 binuclear cluster domain-containing protein isoform 1 [Cladophialophora immunda]|nr:Fungal Zn2-Cys6 binuclear cluster domain-containing protein isoform 1 [Cladophialophora immunda]